MLRGLACRAMVCGGVLWMVGQAYAADTAAPDFVVATSGSDSAAGTADAPFATLDHARDAVRNFKIQHPDRKAAIHVQLHGGTYFLAQPVNFIAADSGTADAPVIYENAPGETPVVSGGVPIRGMTVDAAGRWTIALPEVKEGKWNFQQLFVDGQRRMRPRLPKDSYFHIAGEMPHSTPKGKRGEGDDAFKFKPGTISANWSNLGDIEVMNFHPWFASMLRIESVDEKESVVTFTGRTRSGGDWAKLKTGMRYIVENVKEALDTPGQWYLDRPVGVLTYIPRPGENVATASVIAPRLERLIVLDGAETRPTQYLTFRGLTFAHTNWVTPADGSSDPQAAVGTTAAIMASNARHCVVENCTVTLTGAYAVSFGIGCKENRVESCRMVDLGCGGVKIGTTGVQNDEEQTVSNNVVRDNLIAHACRVHPGAVGVWIGQADHTTVEHNDIYDLYYTAISVGWTWGYGKSGAHDNIIEFNHLHHIGQAVLSDMGGIYTLGISPGSVLRLNLIHDVRRVDYGGWGIYYDEGTTGMVAEDNLVYHTDDGGFHQHYGEENIFRNNIIAQSSGVAYRSSRVTTPATGAVQDKIAFTFERNIVDGWGSANPNDAWPDLRLTPPRDLLVLDHNLYWNEGKPVVVPPRDKGAMAADPLFVDPEHENFQLKADSPASKIGFKSFDISGAGRLDKQPADLDSVRWPRIFPAAR
jgi:hypothetical protein